MLTPPSTPSPRRAFVGPWVLKGRWWRRPIIVQRGDHVERLALIGPDVGIDNGRYDEEVDDFALHA